MKAVQQSAFIIHSRPYRETSSIVELFTRDFGRVACVAKGLRRSKRGAAVPQPFTPLLASWVGRGPLFTLTASEVHSSTRSSNGAGAGATALEGDYLVGGLYMNELIMRLLEPGDTHARLFAGYQETLAALVERAPMSVVLREFEYLLLQECGYAPDFTRCASSGEAIKPDANYRLALDEGFCLVENKGHSLTTADTDQNRTYSGSAVLAVANGDYSIRAHRRAALHIFRELLHGRLGPRGLISRSLLGASRQEAEVR